MWIQEAVANSRYIIHPHALGRFGQRGLSIRDVRHAIANATSCAAYAGRTPTLSGTNWRVTGPDVGRDEMTVGVEAFEDLGKRALVITVF